jgi:hypothetical protein
VRNGPLLSSRAPIFPSASANPQTTLPVPINGTILHNDFRTAEIVDKKNKKVPYIGTN